MNLNQTLELLRRRERKSASMVKSALSLKRHRQWMSLPILYPSEAFYLPAVNTRARIKWGRIFITNVFQFFDIAADENGPNEPVFFVTVADKSHLTTDQPQQINLGCIKGKLASGLKGLSYIGIIEPGYFNNIYSSAGRIERNVVSWHGHFLVWGISREQLAQHLRRIKPRFTPTMPRMNAVHYKEINRDQFGYKLWYIIKSPSKEYSIGRRRKLDKNGAAKYKQNARKMRPGNRVKLFLLMREIYLDQLALAGGNGRKLLQQIKYAALRQYRAKNGWNDRRP